jgi:fructokinase
MSRVARRAPANVAVALARLGQEVSLRARISDDGFGLMLREQLSANGVSIGALITAKQPTTMAIATLRHAGQATNSFYLNETADWMWQPAELNALSSDVDALYIRSSAMALPPGAAHVETLARRTRSARKHGHLLRPEPAPRRDA